MPSSTAPQRDWNAIEKSLGVRGNAVLPGLLSQKESQDLVALYHRQDGFRSCITMARHGFGRGEYKYFAYPLPPLLDHLRHTLYQHLAPIANHWSQQLGIDIRYPTTLAPFLERCHQAGQMRPTPLILEYGPGDYNCLHQDLYGDCVFPLQAAILLSEPERDFTGGEFVMTETAAGRSHAEVIPLHQGDAVLFAVNQRPVPGKRSGTRRAAMRHGVSEVHSGHRHTVGLIFHDAK